MKNIKDFDLADLQEEMLAIGEKKFRAEQIFKWLYVDKVMSFDGNAIETVLMQYHHGKTVCVSSQIGCKMGCKFCASTGIKFERNLTPGEIVEEVLAVEQDIGEEISNIVFMGIGEPLDNYDNVIKAIRILNNQKGMNIGARHISVSTSGLVPRIYDLANENIQCTLSISLHATTDEKRSSYDARK